MYVMKIQSMLSLKTNNYQIDSINMKILKKSQFMVSKSLFQDFLISWLFRPQSIIIQ